MPIDFTGYMYAHTMIKSHRNYSIFLKKIQEFYFKKLEIFDAKISQKFHFSHTRFQHILFLQLVP